MNKDKLYTGENERPAGLRTFRRLWSEASRDPNKKRDKEFKFKKEEK